MSELTIEATGQAQRALAQGIEHLLSLQQEGGWWRGELQTNVTMDAEDMLLREFLGIRRQAETERSAAWIRSQQRDDGTWANFYGGPGELSTTIEAYWALRLAGDAPEEPHMQAAAAFIRAAGRARAGPRVHAPVAGAVRAVVLGSRAGAAPRDHPAALLGAAQRVRLRLLGAPDDRRAAASSKRTGRCVRWASTWSELIAPGASAEDPPAPSARARLLRRARPGDPRLRAPAAGARCGGWRWSGPNTGSCAARRPTARGAGSSRRGSTR